MDYFQKHIIKLRSLNGPLFLILNSIYLSFKCISGLMQGSSLWHASPRELWHFQVSRQSMLEPSGCKNDCQYQLGKQPYKKLYNHEKGPLQLSAYHRPQVSVKINYFQVDTKIIQDSELFPRIQFKKADIVEKWNGAACSHCNVSASFSALQYIFQLSCIILIRYCSIKMCATFCKIYFSEQQIVEAGHSALRVHRRAWLGVAHKLCAVTRMHSNMPVTHVQYLCIEIGQFRTT